MPTYQYSCTDCGHFFEQFQSFSEDSLTVCPECQGRLRKVFNAVGVVFKGSGFYRTDSRNGAGREGGDRAPEKSGSTSDRPKPDRTAERKPEPKSEPKSEKTSGSAATAGAASTSAA